jgi:hypothetical protein
MSPFSIRSTLMLGLVVAGTSSAYMFLGLSLVVVLIALGLACLVYIPFAKRYGWDNEGRLTRHLSRPPSKTKAAEPVKPRERMYPEGTG